MFQFYDSPIKSFKGEGKYLTFPCFNSMIVRLKVTPPFELYIKMWSFNSMIVRLKVKWNLSCDRIHTSFNSMIVRLKARFERAARRGTFAFQFYDSPIKRLIFQGRINPDVRFNSMIVRLKGIVAEAFPKLKIVSIL